MAGCLAARAAGKRAAREAFCERGAVMMRAMSLLPSAWSGRPTWAEIDLDALAANVRLLTARASPSRVWAVVKANAYGHGAVACGRAALGAGAAGLAVVCVDEGEELRQAGVDAPVLVLGHTPPSDAERVVALRLRPTVAAPELVDALAAAGRRAGWTVPLHLELESGLNRHGLAPDALVALAERARATPGVEVEGLFTHFAAAEEGDQRFTRRQFDVLREVSARLPFVKERHCAASASVLLDKEMALVMCGYADGYRRGFGNRAHVLVRGRRAPVVGRVAMDMCMVDVTAVPGAAVGDVATLLGRDGDERVDADELAALADTISWEILAAVTARVPRLYLRGGIVEAVSTLTRRAPAPPGAR